MRNQRLSLPHRYKSFVRGRPITKEPRLAMRISIHCVCLLANLSLLSGLATYYSRDVRVPHWLYSKIHRTGSGGRGRLAVHKCAAAFYSA